MTPELFGALLREVVVPLLVELEQEGHQVRPVLVSSVAEGARIADARIEASPENTRSEPMGEIRIGGRPLFAPGRVRFVVEAIFERQQKNGFTGFEIGGSANETGANIQIKSRIMRYNVSQWRDKLVVLSGA